MTEVVTVSLDSSEGNTTQTVDLQDALRSLVVGDHDNIGFFADTDLVADGVDAFLLLVGVEGEVIETSIGEAITVI